MAGPASSILLAGGKSSRMGTDKASIHLAARVTMIQSIVEKLRTVTDEVIIVTAGQRYEGLGVKWAEDIYEGAGPLGGIYAGLLAAAFNRALVVACDMPFLNPSLLQYMVDFPGDWDVLIPRLVHGLEPLHAIYSQSCLGSIERLLEASRYSILDLFDQVVVRYLSEDEIRVYDPYGHSFFNVNTPDQLRQARRIIGQGVG